MIISHEHRFIFIHIHKTGGQSVATALAPYLGPQDIVVDGHLDKPSDQPGLRGRPLLKHSAASEIRDAMDPDLWAEYRKFTVVRDPVARMQSFYSYLGRVKATRDRPLRRIWYMTAGRRGDPMTWSAMKAFVDTGTFSEFIRHPATLADPAMRSQWSMMADDEGSRLVDFVARTETLSEDFTRLVSWLGLPEPITLPHINVSQSGSAPPPLDAADASYIGEIFGSDFQHLGYGREQ